jgi:hypothetical protein
MFRRYMKLARRSIGQPQGLAEVVALCGHLPLAISLLARVFIKHESWSKNDLIDATKSRLLTVTAENRTVAGIFDLSYRYLTADE